jgi:hypothetical protein
MPFAGWHKTGPDAKPASQPKGLERSDARQPHIFIAGLP